MLRVPHVFIKAAITAAFYITIFYPASAQEEAPVEQPEETQSEEVPVAKATVSEANSAHLEVLQGYGWLIGQQAVLYVGFTDEELNNVMYGMVRAAKGHPAPENLEELIPKVDEIIKAKAEAFEERQQKLAAEVAPAYMSAGDAFLAEIAQKEGIKKTDTGLYYELLDEGIGRIPSGNDIVRVSYTGTLIDGQVFDTSEVRGGSVDFPLNGVIPGFSQGLQLVREGGKIKLYVPAYLGYGDEPSSNIPPGSTLIFEAELIEVNPIDFDIQTE